MTENIGAIFLRNGEMQNRSDSGYYISRVEEPIRAVIKFGASWTDFNCPKDTIILAYTDDGDDMHYDFIGGVGSNITYCEFELIADDCHSTAVNIINAMKGHLIAQLTESSEMRLHFEDRYGELANT